MIKKITLLTLILLFSFKNSFADQIDKETAISIATKWINFKRQTHGNTLQNSTFSPKEFASIKEVSFKKQIVYYIVNFKKGGFVIVAASNSTKPILGYSNNSFFDASSKNPTTKNLLNAYKTFVYKNVLAQKVKREKTDSHNKWNQLLKKSPKNQFKAKMIIPFMGDILYKQSQGFEKFCPSSDDEKAVVGCVATAMAQVMRYWEFPTTGKSQTSYNHKKYGAISVNFENQRYDWDNMSKINADDENAKLSYHAGVSVKMNYGISSNGGSSARTRDALSALKKNFKYHKDAKMIYKHNYSDVEWSNIIKEQLDEKRPVLYTGRSENLLDPTALSSGHLFTLDGYDATEQGDFFHINWGWGGRSNGFFSLTDMVTHDGRYNWIDNNAIIIDLYPTNMAPIFKYKPTTTIDADTFYKYKVNVWDENRNDIVTVSLKEGPSWISLLFENGNYVLRGIPTHNDIGKHTVVIEATDGINKTTQEFNLTVLKKEKYCRSRAYKTEYEWIDAISFGGMVNTSGRNGGYTNFMNKTATITAGTTSPLTITTGSIGSPYTEHLSTWIDYNQNGIFEESERIVNQATNSIHNTYSIKIPNNALSGITKMRVSIKYGTPQTACEIFSNGEVEDYNVNIIRTSSRKNKTTQYIDKNIPSIDLQIYPNPSNDFINIKTSTLLKSGYYQIIDIHGKIVIQNSLTPSIDIKKLKTGTYFIKIFDKDNHYSKSFIKSER
ncbi:Probable C10 family peptidase, streptopain, precursor containing a C-terminal secretion signal [Tenacibaculum maritimum]|uniref:C10 family peptidase n=1 Tax=Tenacibaculum maritimum TaxID=107401 RepID=UPI0012E5CB47|nr:C10 family peptidase [Tenacibaculum maritimum]CAA0218885.1 Probable C10 family peptidase, streptopain, precursor containing a C-terminal secretion signal [Tenacibaculum maritimum]